MDSEAERGSALVAWYMYSIRTGSVAMGDCDLEALLAAFDDCPPQNADDNRSANKKTQTKAKSLITAVRSSKISMPGSGSER